MGRQIRKDPIRATDLIEFLVTTSDFDFELRVLRMLRQHGLECTHGGHYEDPITKKSRQFDIRAMKTIPDNASNNRIRLSVECKNIGDNFPVLISCTPRQDDESFHDLLLVGDVTSPAGKMFHIHAFESRAKKYRMKLEHSIYKPGRMVGKSTAQIGRLKDGGFTSNDEEFFDKWSQCLSSATDLIDEIYWDGKDEKGSWYLSTVIPIVVIPDGSLWVAEYDNDGKRCSDPAQADRCPCFVNRDYQVGNNMAGDWMSISHIEIMTFSGLDSFVKEQLCSDRGMSAFFPLDGVMAAVKNQS